MINRSVSYNEFLELTEKSKEDCIVLVTDSSYNKNNLIEEKLFEINVEKKPIFVFDIIEDIDTISKLFYSLNSFPSVLIFNNKEKEPLILKGLEVLNSQKL